MSHLAVTVTPATGESWPGYLTRLAAANHTTMRALGNHLGIRRDERWPPLHGVVVPAGTTIMLAGALRTDQEQITAMQLSHFDGTVIDLRPLAAALSPTTARACTQAAWVRFAGSRFCPACLAADGIWRLEWRLPWTLSCPTHRVVLAHLCPSCAMPVGTGRTTATTTPVRDLGVPDTRRCSQALPGTWGETCGGDLTRTQVTSASIEQLTLDAHLRRLRTAGDTVAGTQLPALAAFGAWRRVICWAVALGELPAGPLGWRTARPWMTPPSDAAVMARALAVAEPVVHAGDPRSAAEVVRGWVARAGFPVTPATFRDCARPGPVTDRIVEELLARHGRSHSQLRRTVALHSGADAQMHLTVAGFTARNVPQLVWPCLLPEGLRDLHRPGPDLLRAVMALMLVRIAQGGNWSAAGLSLGWDARRGSQWVRYTMGARNAPTGQQLLAASFAAAVLLARRRPPHGWEPRPTTCGSTPAVLSGAQRPDCAAQAGTGWCPCSNAA